MSILNTLINPFSSFFIVTQTGNPRYVFYGYDFCKKNCAYSYANESPWPYIKKVFSVEIKYFPLKRKQWCHASPKFINGKTDYSCSWTEGSWIVSVASTRSLPHNILPTPTIDMLERLCLKMKGWCCLHPKLPYGVMNLIKFKDLSASFVCHSESWAHPRVICFSRKALSPHCQNWNSTSQQLHELTCNTKQQHKGQCLFHYD